MTPLPPDQQRRIDELVAAAPPLSPAQQRIIQRALTGSPAARAA